MEKEVSSLMTQEITHDFLDRFGLDREVKKLGDFENYVYETDCEYRLRVSIVSFINGIQ
ncbi:hypothetical protein G3A_09490 [Bacillus sp. 17376]|uniref:Uncharacterized protein n=1 Tax=Mesobacillus boroniphilus JCM 21738 TaxID=1294265 RepID=W4RUH7_9BACI|nr:hypothetical protein [Mesobacillus boroniphilus]ESU32786.1 hypothetical protein G3A_09490 [Bacillus sp. 17376]GAE47767.1 hypothetical protein JCM21738_4782 [Mesobacillus boroniphilus JCM 21738]